MKQFSGRVWWVVAAVAMVVAMAQVAEAQREEGRRGRGGRGFGGFGVSSVRLAAESDEVQAALKLTDEQKKKAAEINDEFQDARRDLFQQGGGGDFRQMRTEMDKLNQDALARLSEVLDEQQRKRLMGISIQISGVNALIEPAVDKELNVTDAQKAKLADVREANFQAFGDAFREMRDQDLSRDERRAKFAELTAEADKKLMAELTSEQQAQLEVLKGEPVEIDMSEFRGPGGGGGFDGRGRRGDRDRDRQDSGGESGSEETSTEAASSSN